MVRFWAPIQGRTIKCDNLSAEGVSKVLLHGTSNVTNCPLRPLGDRARLLDPPARHIKCDNLSAEGVSNQGQTKHITITAKVAMANAHTAT